MVQPLESKKAWNLEYQKPEFLSKENAPTKEFLNFLRWLRKDQARDLGGLKFLDLGTGLGRNVLYTVGEFGATGVGLDVSSVAIEEARIRGENLPVEFFVHDLNHALQLADTGFDVVIDSTASHLLPMENRKQLVAEAARVLRSGGYYYLRTLTLDGDRNARNLIKEVPGPEENSYIHPQLVVAEYMLTEREIRELYEPWFEVLHLKKYTGYQRVDGKSYKRRYIAAYLKKKDA